jgi:hypothetical protein
MTEEPTQKSGDSPGPPPDPPDLPDRTITDAASFARGTTDERAVAGLLFYKELDCLVELAHAISIDFFDQPQLYRDVPPDIRKDLAELRARYGYQEEFLSREQRQAIFAGVFGDEEGAGLTNVVGATPAAYSFAVLRDQLLAAAAAFAERVFDTSEDMLRAAVRVMHVYLKDYLQDVTGASVWWSRDVGLPKITERCYRILRNQQIAARFAVNATAGPDFPFAANANGSKLVEQISHTPMRLQIQPISRGAFNDKQQLGLRGAEALATVIDYKANDPDKGRTDHLITNCYTWYAARGRVLHLPVAVSLPPSVAPAAVPAAAALALPSGAPAAAPAAAAPALMPPALAPAMTVALMDGRNRSLYGSAPGTISGVVS